MDCGSIGLFSLHTLNVDNILLPVDLHYFADLLAFVVSTDNLLSTTKKKMKSNECKDTCAIMTMLLQYLDFVIFADGHGPHIIFLAEFLGQGGRHDLPPDV